MKKTLLSTMIATAGVLAAANSAHAIFNLYKQDGLSLDINGEVNLYAETDKKEIEGQFPILKGLYQDASDERVRLAADQGSSWIDFRASQTLPNDWRVTGTLGMGYTQAGSGTYLNSANVSLDKLNVGAITLGRQYLHTGHVTRTGTYTPLDTFGEQAVRLDYYGLPNLHTSAYYLLPSSNDVRSEQDFAEVEGYGASASYKLPITDNQSLRLAAGYSNNRANPQTTDAFDAKSDNYAASLEYRAGRFLAAADYGHRDAKLNGQTVAGVDSDYLGFKLGFEVTPRFNIVAGYGKKESDRKYANGLTAQEATDQLLGQFYVEDGAGGYVFNPNTAGLSAQMSFPFMFEKLEEQQAYVRGDYYARENLRFYGQAQKEEVQAKQEGRDYAKLDNTSYRLGVSFVF